MLNLICKELGLEIGEEWTVEDDFVSNTEHRYKIEDNQLLYYCDDCKKWEEAWDDEYRMLMKGELVPNWKPKSGERYWTVDFSEIEGVWSYAYAGTLIEKRLLDNELIFKTKEDAIECANKMLGVIKKC